MTTDTEALRAKFDAWQFGFNPHHYPAEWAAYQAGHAAALADQKPPAVNDNAGCAAPVNDNAGRWYMLDNNGMATLCASEADALSEAAAADAAWPRNGPHRAVQLVPAAKVAAAVTAERERAATVVDEKIGSVRKANPGRGGRINSAVAFALDALGDCAGAIRAGGANG